MNTSKNSYVIIYMIVIVVIVSLLLSITSGVLHSRQEDNMRLDTKKQILMSLSELTVEQENKLFTDDNAADMYAQYVKQYVMLDTVSGEITELDPVADFDVKPAENQLPYYIADVDGATKYIIRLDGVGLWGAIRAYVALNDDRNTIYGIYFGHASETPGLGANIVTPKFRSQFVGKQVLRDGLFASIAVMKKGQTDGTRDQVDAVSGGTITSKGVESMFQTSLGRYAEWLTAVEPVAEEVTDTVCEEVVEPVNEGGNE